MSSITTTPTRIRTRQIKSADEPLSAAELDKLDAYWRALNYLAVGQIYLMDNPLLRGAAQTRAYQAAPFGPLGYITRPQHVVRASQSRHQKR